MKLSYKALINFFMFFFFLKHLILLTKLSLEYAIHDIPHEVATLMARVEYQRREALKVRLCQSVWFFFCPFELDMYCKTF
jgi:hypothetical protein